MSKYLFNTKDILKELISKLSEDYNYVSVLGTDISGKSFSVTRTGIDIGDSHLTERGFVLRVHNGINYSEFSFNKIDNIDSLIENVKNKINGDLERLKNSNIKISSYPIIEEEKIEKSFHGDVEILPSEVTDREKIDRMTNIMNKALSSSEHLIDFRVGYNEIHISKVFVSTKKDLEQTYIASEGYLAPIVRRDNNTKYNFEGFSGLKGAEILDEMESGYEQAIETAVNLLDAKKVKPGEYDIICAPDITGLIAHEAFGHGVEMDMFVKNRAKAVEYLDKAVASDLVVMHDGAKAAKQVGSHLFDDEGTMGTDTVIIDNGILKTGISDLLSAQRLGTKPTGNGKRESFERKAYARMTNTFISPGNDDLEDIIASIDKGYLLEGLMSGMEDPKNWGIQCMILQGKEIIDGKLTGNIISPVIMTGYVPDLLKSISMISKEEDFKLFGSGMCGKGHKEWVKNSNGGSYIKARGRLG